MRVPRLLCPAFPDRGPARLGEAETRHLVSVLRAAPGDAVELIDGRGRRARARFVRVDLGTGIVEVESVEASPARPRVALAVAVPKGNRADWMIQKATEAGLDLLLPILTKRGVATAEGAQKRARWDRIAAEAAKQCGRASLPDLLDPRPLKTAIAETAAWPHRFLADAAGRPGAAPPGDAVVFVGPEGGWSPEEAALLAGLEKLRLAPYVLRVETAAVLAVAALANR